MRSDKKTGGPFPARLFMNRFVTRWLRFHIVRLGIVGGIEGVSFVRFTDRDVVRHGLVTRIVRAYDRVERERKGAAADEESR